MAEEERGLVHLPQYQHGLLPPPLQLILLLLRLGSLDWWVRWLPLLVGLLLAPLWWVISRVILVTIMFSWAPKFIDTFGIGLWCCTGIWRQLPTTQLQRMCLLLFCFSVGFYPTKWKCTHIILPVFIICVHFLSNYQEKKQTLNLANLTFKIPWKISSSQRFSIVASLIFMLIFRVWTFGLWTVSCCVA